MHAPAHARPILVIDDDATSLELVVEVLGLDGYAVRKATTAEQGLALVAHELPALILMDLHFAGGMSGIDATRRLKGDPRTVDIPVVALTGLAEREAERRAGHAGFAAYLTKPLDVTTLRETVRRFVGEAPG